MQSMTGYGTAVGKIGRGRIYIEVKTLNHRYCEVFFKIPPRMGALESPLRESIQQKLERGKVDLFLRELKPVFGEAELVLDVALAKKYSQALKDLQKALHVSGKQDPISLLGLERFVASKEKEGNYADFSGAIQKLVEQALSRLQQMRAKEGNFLLKDQKKRLKKFAGLLEKISVRDRHNTRKRIKTAPVSETNGQNNFAGKTDITEELTRLKSHTRQYEALFRVRKPVGRKLDFLIQEMHREMNTIGSKACDAQISQHIVASKSLLENLREQVQNIL